jgi:hypothetical protein
VEVTGNTTSINLNLGKSSFNQAKVGLCCFLCCRGGIIVLIIDRYIESMTFVSHAIYDLSGEKIYIDNVMWEVSQRFVISAEVALYSEIHRICIIAYNDQRRASLSKRPVEEIAKEVLAQQELDFNDD